MMTSEEEEKRQGLSRAVTGGTGVNGLKVKSMKMVQMVSEDCMAPGLSPI